MNESTQLNVARVPFLYSLKTFSGVWTESRILDDDDDDDDELFLWYR